MRLEDLMIGSDMEKVGLSICSAILRKTHICKSNLIHCHRLFHMVSSVSIVSSSSDLEYHVTI